MAVWPVSPVQALKGSLVLAASLLAAGAAPAQSPFHVQRVHGHMPLEAATLQRWSRQHALEARAPMAGVAVPRTAASPPIAFSLLGLVDYVPAERDQGACGDCWAWASTGMAEVALNAQYGLRDRLSVQYFDSARTDAYACDGGTLTDFCDWYTGSGGESNNAHPGVLVPWNNAGGTYFEGHRPPQSEASIVPAAQIALNPAYTGVAMTPALIPTSGQGQAQAIANIQAALLNNQAVGFSFFTDFADQGGFEEFWETQPEAALWHNAYEYALQSPGWGGHMVMVVGYDASDPVPANHYWVALDSWGITSDRPNGLFRMPMQMDYDATFTNGATSFACYSFETLTLQSLNPVGTTPVAAAVAVPSAPLQVGMPLALTAALTAGSLPLTYQWSLNGTPVPGATNATFTLPYVLPELQGQPLALTVSNAQGPVALAPIALNVLGSQLLPDPGFEDGASTTSWTSTEEAEEAFRSSTDSHSGGWLAALLGNGAVTLTSAPLALPPGPGPLIVSYWLWTDSGAFAGVVNTCTVQLVDGAGTVLRVLRTHSNLDSDHLVWAQESFDVSALQGQTVALQVTGQVSATCWFFLDDFGVVPLTGSTASPYIQTLSPPAIAPGAQVALGGYGFTGATLVAINGAPCTFAVISDSSILATVPQSLVPGPIRVAGPLGAFTSNDAFTSVPFLGGFAPPSGSAGTMVTLTGNSLLGATAVTFNGIPAAAFTVVNAGQIVATAPLGVSSGPITVTVPGGTLSLPGFVAPGSGSGSGSAPALSSFAPPQGPPGTRVILQGTGFTGTTSVAFAGVPAQYLWVDSDSTISTLVPGLAGDGPITVSGTQGLALSQGSFTVLPLTLTSFSPVIGSAGTTVTLTGTGLAHASVEFSGGGPINSTSQSDTKITVTVPPMAITGPVLLMAGGTPIPALAQFTVIVTVAITTPQPDNLLAGAQKTFWATVTGASDLGVTWSVSAGSLDDPTANPVTFTAPASPGPVTLTATSMADPTRSASMVLPIGSANLDGASAPDILDLALLAAAYGRKAGEPGYLAALDLDGDGVIDDADITLFLNVF